MDKTWQTVVSKPHKPKNPNPPVILPKTSIQSNFQIPDQNLKKEPLPDVIKKREITTEFKNTLKQSRMRKNLTQKQLAQMVNVRQKVIEDLENGILQPNPQLLNKISKVLDVKLPKLEKKIVLDERDPN